MELQIECQSLTIRQAEMEWSLFHRRVYRMLSTLDINVQKYFPQESPRFVTAVRLTYLFQSYARLRPGTQPSPFWLLNRPPTSFLPSVRPSFLPSAALGDAHNQSRSERHARRSVASGGAAIAASSPPQSADAYTR